MNCLDASPLLDAWLDGELDAANTLSIERHTADCARCRDDVGAARSMRASVRSADLYRPAPDALKARLLTLAAAAQAGAPVPDPRVQKDDSGRASRWRARPVWGAVAALLVVAFGLLLWLRSDASLEEREVVDAHVRSLLAEHLVDVPSSDRHTVKPWFNGRLDFAVDVPDFANEGFPLAGGRLEVIEGRRVAALVYKRRAHVINVFVYPHAPERTIRGTREGYHFERWTRDGRCWWVVSDLSPDELHQFVERLSNG